ncbi:MAG: DUF2281 domain-containing protein [Phototrophicaceae bacterium]|jgi:antitoxin (DNA-binding transcriptional repressor) of toxin-antitoxin stability system
MIRYSLQEAQLQLEQLIAEAQHGNVVLIYDGNTHQAVQLVPIPTPKKPRKAGSAKGQIEMAADFDSPLSDFDEYT